MSPSIVETFNVTREVAWLPWAVQYFFLIGLSYGAFLVSLPGIACRRPGWEGISRLALLAAVVCGLTAPVALAADLHQPGRFWRFYAHLTASSWMSWGAFFIPLYVGGLLLYAWLAFRPLLQRHADEGGAFARTARMLAYGGHESRGALNAAAVIALVGAALVALYSGMEVMAVRARPLWHTPLLPLHLLATAIAGGLGMTLLLNRFRPGKFERDGTRRLARALALAELAILLLGVAWLVLAVSGVSTEHAALLQQVAASTEWQIAGSWALVATVVTLLFAWKRPGTGLVIGLLALDSSWMARWTLFIGGQELPKTGAGYYHYDVPFGYDGFLGMLATAGLWVFLFVALTTVLPLGRIGHARATGA